MTLFPVKLNEKFIVLSDISTGKPFTIFFDSKLPSFHKELFEAASKFWKEKGKEIGIQGGGRFSIIGNYALFHSKSNKYGRFEDDVVMDLARKHDFFQEKEFIFICKAGEEDPWKLIEK